MRKNIHPNYHKVTVKISNSDLSFETYSACNGDTIIADANFKKHPAWTGKGVLADANSAKVSKFNSKFGNLFGAKEANPSSDA